MKSLDEKVKAPATSPPLAIAKPPDAVAIGPGSGLVPFEDDAFDELELITLELLLDAIEELEAGLELELTAMLEEDFAIELDATEELAGLELELTALLDATELELATSEELLDTAFELELAAKLDDATELELGATDELEAALELELATKLDDATELELAAIDELLDATFELELVVAKLDDAKELELGTTEELELAWELELMGALDAGLELAGTLDATEAAELAGITTSTDLALELLTKLEFTTDDELVTELDIACALEAGIELLVVITDAAADETELTTADDTVALNELGVGALALPFEPPPPPQAERAIHSKPVDITLICMRHSCSFRGL